MYDPPGEPLSDPESKRVKLSDAQVALFANAIIDSDDYDLNLLRKLLWWQLGFQLVPRTHLRETIFDIVCRFNEDGRIVELLHVFLTHDSSGDGLKVKLLRLTEALASDAPCVHARAAEIARSLKQFAVLQLA